MSGNCGERTTRTVFKETWQVLSYFDFISWVQFSTLTFCINEASTEPFIEIVGAEATSQKINPFPMLDSKEKIQEVHKAITGDGILDYILSTYPANILPKGVPLSGSTETVPGGRVVKSNPPKVWQNSCSSQLDYGHILHQQLRDRQQSDRGA